MKKIALITFSALAFTGIASAQLSVQKGGRVEVGPFKAGGKLTFRAKDVKMTPGFNVEKGGILQINRK